MIPAVGAVCDRAFFACKVVFRKERRAVTDRAYNSGRFCFPRSIWEQSGRRGTIRRPPFLDIESFRPIDSAPVFGANNKLVRMEDGMGRFLFIALVVLTLLAPGHAFAQTNYATLGGTVMDASSALIPGVTLTATNTETGIVTTV